MSAPDLPRFKVASVSGYSLNPSTRPPSVGYYVLDTWDLCREVARFPVQGDLPRGLLCPNATEAQRRAAAEQRCAELEAWHEEAMAHDAA